MLLGVTAQLSIHGMTLIFLTAIFLPSARPMNDTSLYPKFIHENAKIKVQLTPKIFFRLIKSP